jgi:hypothetical protein
VRPLPLFRYTQQAHPTRLFSSAIALWETHIDPLRASDLEDLIKERDNYQEPEEDPEPYREEDTASDDQSFEHNGEPEEMEISKVKFKELTKSLPDLTMSTEGKTLALVRFSSFFSLLSLKLEVVPR